MGADTGATPGDRFPTTELSVLRRIREGSLPEKEAAYEALIAAYWRPTYTYLRLRWREEPADAEDLTQEFLAAAWTKGFFDRYEPGRARFRTFLRVCLDRHVQNQRKAARALKRGGGTRPLSLDFVSAEGDLRHREPADSEHAEYLFQQEFVRSLFTDALGRLRAELEGRGRGVVYAVFDRYELGPADGVSYAKIAEELGVPVSQVTNHLHVARSRFRELVVERLRELSGSEEEFREEAKEILGLELP